MTTRQLRIVRIALPSAAILCGILSLLLLFTRPRDTGGLRTTLNVVGGLLVVATVVMSRPRSR